MAKFSVGQLLITERPVNIFIEEFNGKIIDTEVDYHRGEVFEILEVIEEDSETNYVIEFGTDNGQMKYTFDEWQVEDFLQSEGVEHGI